MAERTAGELAFIDQRTRQLMVLWADHCIRKPEGILDLDSIPPYEPSDSGLVEARNRALHEARKLEMHREYFDHAVAKGWIGKKVTDGRRRLTAAGWKTAAAFLKR